MDTLIPEMARLLSGGQSFVLATVIRRAGSAPRSAGAKMLVRPDGSTLGTVGGGILEAQVEQLAAEVQAGRGAALRHFQFSGQDAATMDAICGGEVDVLVEWCDPADPELISVVEGLAEAQAGARRAWWVTALPESGDPSLPAGREKRWDRAGGAACRHFLVQASGQVSGSLPETLVEAILDTRQPGVVVDGGQEWLIEPFGASGAAYIFGAGHVSRGLAQFTRAVGFRTIVLDDRADYASPQRFPDADQLVVLDSFERAFQSLSLDRDSFVVIVTRGHLHDRIVLAQALRTEAGYIGMIGSRRKCALVFDELRRLGFGEEELRRVHAPIGLSICAETPEEIGVSIVAEMIQIRAGLRKDGP